jgi:hypothetical protein
MRTVSIPNLLRLCFKVGLIDTSFRLQAMTLITGKGIRQTTCASVLQYDYQG